VYSDSVRALLALWLLLPWFAGCAPAIPRIDPSAHPFSELSPSEVAELRRGRSEYVAKCSGCHVLYHPSSGNPTYWKLWVREMAECSKLAPDEQSRIENYLLEVCSPE
jgi:hypothetical protein